VLLELRFDLHTLQRVVQQCRWRTTRRSGLRSYWHHHHHHHHHHRQWFPCRIPEFAVDATHEHVSEKIKHGQRFVCRTSTLWGKTSTFSFYVRVRGPKIHQFLTCVSHTAHVLDIGWMSVRLSVRHTLVLCQNGSTYHQTVFTAW